MVVNTTDEQRTITFLSDSIGGAPIVAAPGEIDIKAEGKLVVRIPGTSLEMARTVWRFLAGHQS
jgi:hypothetical protein